MTERRRLADERAAKTATLRMTTADGEIQVYVTVGLYEDGTPGELFLKVDRQGSTISGFADALAIAVSLGLQHGVPLSAFVSKFRSMRFEPAGRTSDPKQPVASSFVDLVAGWLERAFT